MTTCYFLDAAQFREAENKRMALGEARGKDTVWLAANNATYGWASLSEIITPGAMWFVPWYFDPTNPEHAIRRERALANIADGTFGSGGRNYYLSRFYWQTWSATRSPIYVLCPNGKEWCVDAKSSNGDGWQVQGDPPKLIVTPSILVPGYHGFLGSNGAAPGVFTGNI